MPKLTIAIKCGERTCASSPGNFCAYIGSRKMGQQPICCLFPDDVQTYTVLLDVEGWVQRCDKCIEAQRGVTDAHAT